MDDDFRYAICRAFHDEHMASSHLLDALEELLAKGGRGLPDLETAAARHVLSGLATAIPTEVHRHFAFEEVIFERLAELGEAEIGRVLTAEHRVILPVADRAAKASATALTHGMSESQWEVFRSDAAELIERLQAHILKEEKALLPLLEEVLTPEEDLAFSEDYAAMATA